MVKPMTNEEIKKRAKDLISDLEPKKSELFKKITESIDMKDVVILAELHGRVITLVGEGPFDSMISISFRVRDKPHQEPIKAIESNGTSVTEGEEENE